MKAITLVLGCVLVLSGCKSASPVRDALERHGAESGDDKVLAEFSLRSLPVETNDDSLFEAQTPTVIETVQRLQAIEKRENVKGLFLRLGSFGGGKASIATSREPFALAVGNTLDFVGANGPFTVTLSGAGFANIGAATAEELAAALRADAGFQASGLVANAQDGALVLQRVHSDTRSLQAGDLFVAVCALHRPPPRGAARPDAARAARQLAVARLALHKARKTC